MPAQGTLKLNVDASVFEGSGVFSVGLVVRDYQGHFLQGRTMKFAGSISVLEAEMVGILEALKWLQDFPEHNILEESNSMLSVAAINRGDKNQLEIGDLIEQCRVILHNRSGVLVVFARKQANKVAHLLARFPCTLNSFVDFTSHPLCVLETLLSDV